MNHTTMAGLPTIQFLSVCQYISAFSIFFTNIDLMSVDEQNQTAPVINAVFKYLNESVNESEAKSQLLLKILKEPNIYFKESNIYRKDPNIYLKKSNIYLKASNFKDINTLDMKYVNETYQYIINEGLFQHNRNIEYLSGIENITKNEAFSLKDIHHLSVPSLYIDNLCSVKNGSTKLTPLAIEKLSEYISPAYNQEKTISNGPGKLVQHKRLRRQPFSDVRNFYVADNENISAIEPLLNDQPTGAFDIDSYAMNYDSLVNNSDYIQQSLDTNENTNTFISEIDSLIKAQPNFTFEMMKSEDRQSVQKFLESDSANLGISNGGDLKTLKRNKENSDDRPNVSNKIRRIETDSLEAVGKNEDFKVRDEYVLNYITGRNDGKSKRLLFIENAADFMISCAVNYTLTDAVSKLKGYLLKLEKSTTPVPTYNQLAWDFCYNTPVLANYYMWQIPNHKFINDLLFKSRFENISTAANIKAKYGPLFRQYPDEFLTTILEKYKNSIELQESIQVLDFLLLKLKFVEKKKMEVNSTKERIKAALYRFALRESEKDCMENKIVLYSIHCCDRRSPISAKDTYTLNKPVEFSTNYAKEASKLDKFKCGTSNIVMLKIELENQAGIVNIDRLFDTNITDRYIIPPDTSFLIRNTSKIIIFSRKVLLVEIHHDKRQKEEKMIEMVTKLNDLFTNSPETFLHYN